MPTGSFNSYLVLNGIAGGRVILTTPSGVINSKLAIVALNKGDFVEVTDVASGQYQVTRIGQGAGMPAINQVKKTIGYFGVAGCDFNTGNAANQTQFNQALGLALPPLARVLDVFTRTNVIWTSLVSLALVAGNASAGAQFIASAASYAADAVTSMLAATALQTPPSVAASDIWIGLTPGANWSLGSTGKISVYASWIDVSSLQ
jgi:hypothetical protein